MKTRMWAVVSDKCIFAFSVRTRRSDAVSAFIDSTEKSWAWWRRKYGYTIKRVTVTVDEEQKEKE